MIQLKNLSKYFGNKKVLDNISYAIPDQESLAIIGPSGCGKSTLLRLLLRLETPTAGLILINDADLAKLDEDQLVKARQKIGMVFQSGALFDSLTVFENVAFPLREHARLSEREIKRQVAEKLNLVEMAGTEELMPSELSGGMQKRVGIARALAFSPAIILFDEPTTGLDPITSVIIEKLMIKLSRELKATSIVVTHVMQTVERTAKKVVMLHEGKFIEVGAPEEARGSKNPVVSRFINGGR